MGFYQETKTIYGSVQTMGFFRFNTVTKKIKNFDELDGLQGNEFNYGAYHKTKNGVLIYGGTNGITYFKPK